MADTKISNLNTATTPLAGTEVLPVVQAGETKKVPVSTFQTALVSGTNIKTINGNTLLGSGDLSISGGSSTLTIQNKTAAYTVVADDNGTIINCTTNTFTVSLTAAATLGAGFNCWVWNTAYGTTITVDPNASETLDGQSTLLLRSGEGTQIICDGANWQTGDKKTMRGYAESMNNGSRASVTGLRALAIGYNANCASSYGTALGQNSGAQGSVTNAAGNGAMALGGSYASGSNSFAAAVANNTSSYGATGLNSVAIGYQARATGEYSVAIGSTATSGSNATGVSSFAVSGGSAAALYSSSIGPSYSNIIGKVAYSGSSPLTQGGLYILCCDTVGVTPNVLTADKLAPSTNNIIVLGQPQAIAFTGIVSATVQRGTGTDCAAWEIKGLIRRDFLASSTVLVNSALTVIGNTPGWSLALSADTTNGGLSITATGGTGRNIRWVANIMTSEASYI